MAIQMTVIEGPAREDERLSALVERDIPTEVATKLRFCQRITIRKAGTLTFITGRYLYRAYPTAAEEPTSYRYLLRNGATLAWAVASKGNDGEWGTRGGGSMSIFDANGTEVDAWFTDKWGWAVEGLRDFDRLAFAFLRAEEISLYPVGTRKWARVEAKRRWGSDGYARVILTKNHPPHCMVGVDGEVPPKGEGFTWIDAFKDADARGG